MAAAFAAGLAGGSYLDFGKRGAVAVTSARGEEAASPVPAPSAGHGGYPAEVLRVTDGDTFEARVGVWPGIAITTRVRLRGIDTPELKARCAEERSKAEAARAALAKILQQGRVEISAVAIDKFGGRVDADVSTLSTPDVAAALLQAGLGRPYGGGRRDAWCS
ncbi:MAG TPA: thermonuclease family protein [Xanthobacteraceae bacterium]|nr:thermonuclease family protein [Xanthobacteraceae bacterium]